MDPAGPAVVSANSLARPERSGNGITMLLGVVALVREVLLMDFRPLAEGFHPRGPTHLKPRSNTARSVWFA